MITECKNCGDTLLVRCYPVTETQERVVCPRCKYEFYVICGKVKDTFFEARDTITESRSIPGADIDFDRESEEEDEIPEFRVHSNWIEYDMVNKMMNNDDFKTPELSIKTYFNGIRTFVRAGGRSKKAYGNPIVKGGFKDKLKIDEFEEKYYQRIYGRHHKKKGHQL